MVNYVKQARAVMYKLEADSRVDVYHIALYWALFQTWNEHRFQIPMRIYRDEIMKRAKIRSRKTYAKCMRELAAWNYFSYAPGVHHFEPCLVAMRRLDGGKNTYEPAVDQPEDLDVYDTGHDTRDGPNDGPDRVPDDGLLPRDVCGTNDDPNGDTTDGPKRDTPNINSINSTNIQNNLNENTHEQARTISDFDRDFTHPVQTPDAEEKNNTRGGGPEARPAHLEAVCDFFASLHSTRTEAEKFFRHYNSNGWNVGRTPMYDWQESARGWLLRANQFNPPNGPTPGSLASPGPQNHAEPL